MMRIKLGAIGAYITFLVTFLSLSMLIIFPALAQEPDPPQVGNSPPIKLKSRTFSPEPGLDPVFQPKSGGQLQGQSFERVHILLQLATIPDENERANLAANGIQLLAYLPDNAWLASIPANSIRAQTLATTSIRWMGPLLPKDKISPHLQTRGVGPWAVNPDGSVVLDVSFFKDVPAVEALAVIARHGGQVEEDLGDFHHYVVRFPNVGVVSALAGEDKVMWVDNGPPPKIALNDGAREQTNVDAVQQETGLNGSGVVLGIWDKGQVDSTHIDFTGRLTIAESATASDHATHVAGTMAGSGQNSINQGGSALQWRGVATAATIVSYNFNGGSSESEHNDAINIYGIDLSQNSWGYVVKQSTSSCSLSGDYDSRSRDYDDIATGFYGQPILILFSAGNGRDKTASSGEGCKPDGVDTYEYYSNVAGPGGTAKNIVTVGATNSNDDSMTDFSDWGPVDDGRLKPEVVAPGCQSNGTDFIKSAYNGSSSYGSMCGTSMSTPLVSGISALLIQQYRTTYSGNPLPSSIKAVLIHTAKDMDTQYTAYYNPGPDYASGYGRIDAAAGVNAIKAQQVLTGSITNGITDTYFITVTLPITPLKATLVWDDVEATALADPTLVNNLDLELVAPDGTTIHPPWVLDPDNPGLSATTGIDSLNNVEQVYVPTPAVGVWTIRVKGASVPDGPQFYSLVSSVDSHYKRGSKVLLVDDDMQIVTNTVSYYAAALDALEVPYDIWDTKHSDSAEPTASDLAHYPAVIWFTGDAWHSSTVGPSSASETALGSYLDAGNCLFISGKDWTDKVSGIPNSFMQTYLGVQSISRDRNHTQVTGAGSIFGNLGGPYALNTPFSTNYHDSLVPDGTAETAFNGNQSPNSAAVSKDSGIYFTTFWGFPFEALPTASDRLNVMRAFLEKCGNIIPPPFYTVTLTKSTSPGSVVTGRLLTYTLVAQNTGALTSTNIILTDTVPANTTLVPGSPSGGDAIVGGNTITWTTGISLAPGQSLTRTFVVIVDNGLANGSTIVNTGYVSATELSTSSSDTLNTTVLAPSLSLTKSASPTPALAGQVLTYTIVVANSGGADATSVTITDTVPNNTTYVPGSASDGGALEVSDVKWTGLTIAQGTSVTRTFQVTVGIIPDGSTITNTAFVSSAEMASSSYTITTTVSNPPDLSIIKTVVVSGTQPVQLGDPVTYTIVVANNGTGDAPNTRITDTLPVGVIGSDLDTTVMVTAGASLTFTIKAVVALNAPLGVTITNIACYSQTYGNDQSSIGFTTPASVTQSFNVDPTKTTTDTLITFDGVLTVTIPPSPTLPSNAYRLIYTRLTGPSVAAPFNYANLAFDLKLVDDLGQEIISPTFTTPLTIDIHYDVEQLPPGTDENGLKIVYYNSSSGQWETIEVISRDPDNDTLTIQIDHLTEFALTGLRQEIYFPIIVKDNSLGS
jgi:uncharacterized repeat protein (TIGR01451 family)